MTQRQPLTAALNTLLIGVAFTSLPALSQDQQRALEEVIVTAQKRAESVQDVPMSISALSADDLARAGIVNTADLVKLDPSLTFGAGANKQQAAFGIRGVGTFVFSIGVEASVAVVIDDVSTVQAGQSLANLADIERVEVLRGPQSTLFGKSASAGLISVTTMAPADEFESSLELMATDDDETRVAGSVSGPVTDELAYRLSGYWNKLDGYQDNLTYNDDINDTESKGLRGKLRWDISDSIQGDFTAYYNKDDDTCCAMSWEQLDPDARLFGAVPEPVAPGITPSDENRVVRRDDEPDSDTKNSGANARFALGLGEFYLTSISAYDNWTYDDVADVDFSNVDARGFFTQGRESGGLTSFSDVETDFFSQEFRLASPIYDKYDYLVGLYYADAETDREFMRNKGLPIIPSDWKANAETESLALFGQFNWRFFESTQLTAGLRWNDEEVSIDYVNNLNVVNGAAKNSDSDSKVLANVSVQHFLADDIMLYARYAQGYKGQAYNVVTGFNQEDADNPVDPETSESFELGLKSILWDQRLQFNATVFYTEYDDFQAQSFSISPETGFSAKLRNVGELETKGVELDGVALLGENLTLRFAATYLDTEIKSFDNAPCYTGQTEETGCVNRAQNLEGAPLPNAPDWKYNIAADYQLELTSMPFYGFFNISYTWQDDITFSLTQNPLSEEDSYGTANASIGINEKASDRYRVSLFVNNLTDESYSVGKFDASQFFGGKTAVLQNLPRNSERYYGVRLKFSF